jgi:hypothetical protein
MNPSWNVFLSIISVSPVHQRQIEDEISNLSIELILIDVPERFVHQLQKPDGQDKPLPFIAIPSRNVHIIINESNARKVWRTLDGRAIVNISHKLRVIVSIGKLIVEPF